MDRFRRAVESGDIDALVASLSPDVVFQSPVVFNSYAGRDAVGVLLLMVATVLEDAAMKAKLAGG